MKRIVVQAGLVPPARMAKMVRFFIVLILLLPMLALADTGQVTGLPVPRFVSLRSAEVNVRTGPGVRYPIDWVYQRDQMPVEILAEFDVWRKIRDWQGTTGWVHQSMLSGKRTLVMTGIIRSLHRKPDKKSAVVAQVEPGAVGVIEKCDVVWCEVDVAGFSGYIERTSFWGIYPAEEMR